MRRLVTSLALAALLAAAACSNQDNQVFGGVSAGSGSPTPDVLIPDVRSAIHAIGTVTNIRDGSTTQRSIIVLSSADNLCNSLAKTPNYFKDGMAPEGYAALVLMTPPNIDGDFILEAQNKPDGQADVSFLAAYQKGPLALLPGVQGDVSVAQFSTTDYAIGSFNIYVASSAGLAFVYGNYKTNYCAALGAPGTWVPRNH